ncbi:MAG: aldo/keto reductase [Eggerthellaceae bacterium]|nr:aldo/keto reductase [Eggerthellaceae bacterium]
MAYLGEDIPKLGFGLMRLPRLEDKSPDLEQIKQMIDTFLAAGLTYFDTARVYDDSEEVTRKCLIERYPRDAFQLATKNACWDGPKSKQEAEDQFKISMETLGVDYLDYYLLHNIGDTRTDYFDKWDMWNFALGLKEQGLVKHVGFSFHDNADILREQLTKHPEMEFVQLQVNYVDWDDLSIQSRRCMEVACEFEKPVIVMEPVRGGALADPFPKVRQILEESGTDATPADWALRFVWEKPNLITVLSGMSTLEQVEQNIASLENFKPFTDDERKILARAQEAYAAQKAIPCTNCHYCMDNCPVEMNIPGIMQAINRADAFSVRNGTYGYRFNTMGGPKASECLQCGNCEAACPQHIDIIAQLERAVELFGE